MKRCAGLFVFLLGASLTYAQDPGSENLQQQFRDYQSTAPQEKLFVHTDKTFFLAGETLWFKVYAVDASFHKPIGTSRIAYIEILNKDLKPVVQSKVSMTNGNGSGSLTLPTFLLSGNYIFRAYTSWMKNFPADFYFEQPIHIVNTTKLTMLAPPQKSLSSIQFFPEGGNLLAGFTTKIAFKAVDGDGRGLDCKGTIVNQRNDTLVNFQSLHNGMGNFELKPEKSAVYYAVLRLGDSLIKQKLPDAAEQGFTMNLAAGEGDKYKIAVSASPEYNNTQVYLFSQTRQVIKNVQTSTLKDGSAIFWVDKKDLGDGISSITVFNHLRQPVCERLVFNRTGDSLLIQAKTDQPVYMKRKSVNIDVTTGNSAHVPIAGNLSMSVFMIDSLQHIPEQNISTYLYLGSDLKGRIESPGYYLSAADKNRDEALDNLLLTQGWRRFKWNEILEAKKPSFEFLPEIEGPVVNGKIVNKLNGSPVGASDAYLSIPGNDYAFSSATSNAEGIVRFAFKDIYKNNEVVVQPELVKDSIYRVDVSSAYSDKFSSNGLRSLTLSRNQENELLKRSISNQVENTYVMDKKRRYVQSNTDTTSFYGNPDKLYVLEDYTRFVTMEEVLREYVDDVRVRKEGDKYTFKVRDHLFGTYFEGFPLILLDGIPITDATKIMSLDPAKIKKIEVVTHQYYLGSSVFEGIVNVKSYSGEIGATQIDPNALVVEYEGLQQQREFYSPVYDSPEAQESHIPDFRNVLYWAPQISTGPNGNTRLSFFTSDLKGKYVVVVQGLTADGKPGKTITQFEVTDTK
jgi:hypothetical protein